jgi:hypothetical protein
MIGLEAIIDLVKSARHSQADAKCRALRVGARDVPQQISDEHNPS